MPVTSTAPTSRRGYVSQAEVDEMTGLTACTELQISRAEELIDAYVGYVRRYFEHPLTGRASAGGATSFTLQSDHQNIYDVDYFKGLEVEVIGGTGAGQRRRITASTKAGVLTTESFTTALDSTSIYKIYQLGKFPRQQDVFFDSVNSPYTYYKQIPEAVKRATAAQVEFMIKMGDAYFQTDKATMDSESIGDYSYTKSAGSGGSLETLIAPKVKVLLRGIVNRVGTMVV